MKGLCCGVRGTKIAYVTVGVDRYVFFRADADTDYYRSSRPRTDILKPIYVSGVKMKINAKINNNKSSDKKLL